MGAKRSSAEWDSTAAAGSAVRERIVKGARSHFFAHGFRGVTMDELAEELGMSKKTLYAHFPSKTALLEWVLQDKLRRVESDLQRVTGEDGRRFAERLQSLLTAIKSQMEEIQPPFLRDIQREAPELFVLIQTGRRKLIEQHFGKLFREGRRAGTIRKDVPANFLLEYLIGVVDAIINPQKLHELGLTPKSAFSQVITIFLEGIATEKGRHQ